MRIVFAGIVAFVLTLRKGHYRRQFSNFGWTHVSCLIVVGGASFIIGNIFEGLIWYCLVARSVSASKAGTLAF